MCVARTREESQQGEGVLTGVCGSRLPLRANHLRNRDKLIVAPRLKHSCLPLRRAYGLQADRRPDRQDGTRPGVGADY